jgi:CRISPR-associated endonuclease/helicase Cas3
MASLDLLFPVVGTRLPTDHSYPLYSALSHLLPCLHDGSVPFRMAPVTGPYMSQGTLQIDPRWSRLRLRIATPDLPCVLPLSGKALNVMGHRIRLGVPHAAALTPAPSLIARTVAIKKATEVDALLDVARKQLDELGVGGKAMVPDQIDREGRRRPMRQVIRIKGVRIVGFTLKVEGLKPKESLRLQESGLGGRRHMGCGLFLPARGEEFAREN